MEQFDLDKPLIEFSGNGISGSWRIRHSFQGVAVFGNVGSGKTSGSGKTLIMSYLRESYGGLVCVAKPDEKEAWQEYCRLTNREKDLIVVEPGGHYHFNFLDYEASHSKESVTDNVVEVLKTVIKSGEEKRGKGDDPFWENALDMLLVNVIDLCLLAYGKLSVQLLYDIVQSIPRQDSVKYDEEKEISAYHKAFQKAHENVTNKYQEWYLKLSLKERQRLDAEGGIENASMEAIPETRTYKIVNQFFNENFKNLSSKTRGVIEISFSSFLFNLLREPAYSLFCNKESNFSPEDSLEGKIILLNIPVKLYHQVGKFLQVLYKYIYQRAMERRSVKLNPRPVFIVADEAQNFTHPHDQEFQATSRSSRVATVYISQNIPNYNVNMGGEKYQDKVKGFLSTLATKVFHANTDVETNRFASELIGDAYYIDHTESHTISTDISRTKGKSYKLERVVRPEEFIRLKTGGPLNDFFVEGVFHTQGDDVLNGRNHIKMRFNQNYNP